MVLKLQELLMGDGLWQILSSVLYVCVLVGGGSTFLEG